MAIQGGITITGFIAPTSTSATYPVIDPIYGIDGLRNVTGGTEMLVTGNTTSISLERRRAGMIVGINTGDYYKLNNQPWTGTINDWTLLNLMGTTGNYLALSGGTVTGNTIFTSGLTANTLNINNGVTANTLTVNNGINSISGITANTLTVNNGITANTLNINNGITANTLTVNKGIYSISAYTGSYNDGIVVDYTNGNGRISVGTADTITFYNNGIGSNNLMTISSSGTVSANVFSAITLSANTIYTNKFTVNSNGNVTFGTNISSGTSTDMWFDSSNKALNIGNSLLQNTYNLSVNGGIKGNSGLYLGQLSAPTGFTATSGTSGSGSLTGGTYFYQIVASDITGNFTSPSTGITVTIPSGTTNGIVTLSWGNIVGAASYRVYRTINSGQTQYCSSSTSTSLTDVSVTGTSPNQLYSIGSPLAFNGSNNFGIVNGQIISNNGIVIYANPNTNTDITLTRLNTNNISNITTGSASTISSGRLVFKGLAWNGVDGATPNVGFLQVSNVYNNGNPTIDKLSFYVGSASNSNNFSSSLNAVERFNIQTDGSINGLISNRFNLTQSLTGSGNVTLFSGSSIVIGNLTSFQNTFNIGDTLNVGQYGSFIITGITSNSQLEINQKFTGTTGTTGSSLISVILSAGTSNGVVGSSINSPNAYQSVFAPDFRGSFTADSGVYTVTASTGGSFGFTPSFTGLTGSYSIASSAYNANNVPYYLSGVNKFSVAANGNATIAGKLTVTSGVTGTSASVGTAKFTSGVVTLTNTCITSSSKVFLTVTGPSGSVGIPTRSGTTTNSMQIVSLSAGTTSVQTGDNSTFDYWIIN